MGTVSDSDHLDALDGMRGAAVLIVMASHWSNAGFGLLPLSMGGTGKSGVYLFYVLSAYLLTRLMLLRGARTGFAHARLWGDYALRRVLRIWPLYLVVLLLSWVLTVQGVAGWHYQIGTESLLRHLTLREGQSVLWSIPVEFTFYFLLPLLVVAAAWLRRRAPAWMEATVAILLLAAVLAAWPPGRAPVNDYRLWHYLPVFLCGVYAARIDLDLAAGEHKRSWPWMLAGLAALLALVATVPQVWAWLSATPLRPELGHRWFLFFGVSWAVLLLAVLHGPRWLRQPFASRGLRLVGIVSFSAYLWHMPVLDFVRMHWTLRGALHGWIALLLSLGLASLSWWCLERPWRGVRLRRP
ncbi:MAG: acyltransferase [Pseudomonadota bacterium]|nr:acyltransferase [Pseudomonadota bacterium]